MGRAWRRPAVRYATGAGLAVLALTMTVGLVPHVGVESLRPVLLTAVTASAWWGGLGPGLLATVTMLAGAALVAPSVLGLAGPAPGWNVYATALGVEGALLSALGAVARSAWRRAEDRRVEAERAAVECDRAEERAERVERELAYARARAEAIVETALDCVITMDHEGRITEFNPAAERMFGYTRAEVLGEPLAELLIPSALRAAHREALARYVATGTGKVLGRRLETTAMSADGTEIPVELTITAARVRGVPMFAGSVRDIRDRKRHEDERTALLASAQTARAEAEAGQRRLAFLAEASTVVASSLEYATTLESVARLATEGLAEWCLVDVLERDGRIYRVAAHRDPAKSALVQELCTPFVPRAESRLAQRLIAGESMLSADGAVDLLEGAWPAPRYREISWALGVGTYMIVPLRARERMVGAMWLVSAEPGRTYTPDDLALAKELAARAAVAVDNARLYRKAQEANRLKDEFLANVSHELRAPLAAILGWARLLRDGKAKDVPHALDIIVSSGKAQAKLVGDLLDMARIVSGQLRVDLRPLDLVPEVEAAVEAIRPAADAKSIRLECAFDWTAGLVAGDPERLRQLVGNLLANAVKFTPEGGRVEVRLEREDGWARVLVRDTGEGISSEFLPHVFERFRQAEGGTTRRHGGLGLGLPIVRHLAELHGGRVVAESPGAGQGATFTVTLPLLPRRPPVAARPPGAGAESALGHDLPLAGRRVLVVTDVLDGAGALRIVLETDGAEVATAASADEALALVARWEPDLVVGDLGDDAADGHTLIRRIRATHPQRRHLPAVWLTDRAPTDDRMPPPVADDTYLTKPVEGGPLVAAIVRLTGGATGPTCRSAGAP